MPPYFNSQYAPAGGANLNRITHQRAPRCYADAAPDTHLLGDGHTASPGHGHAAIPR